jgi:hypothetical protein
MLNHFTNGDVLDMLAEYAKRADAVIMPVGCPVLLAAPGQREHLPEGLLDACGSIVIANGRDITAATSTA